MTGRRQLTEWQLRAIRRAAAERREAAKQQAPQSGEPSLRQLRQANQDRLRKEQGEGVD